MSVFSFIEPLVCDIIEMDFLIILMNTKERIIHRNAMYQYQKTTSHPPYDTAAWRLYSRGLSTAYFDLETTGLSRRKDAIVIGGLLRQNDDGSQSLSQLLCEHSKKEADMLAQLWMQLKDCHILITYNGDSFDLPFLKEKLLRFGIVSENELPPILSLDLYRIFRRFCPIASLLTNLRQKTVEEALGLSQYRTDQIDGAQSASLYRKYEALLEGELKNQLKEKILLHNKDDLFQLMRLMRLLDKVDLHRIMSLRGFPVLCGRGWICVSRIALNRKKWMIEGSTWGLFQDADVFSPGLRITHSASFRRLSIQISVMYLQGCTVVDLEALPGDYSPLMRYPSYESGYLILHDGKETAFGSMNHCIQLLLSGLELS